MKIIGLRWQMRGEIMAKRDPNFRKDVIELDNYECQICGLSGLEEERRGMIEADHVDERGMGGDPTKDDRDNGMTLCTTCHRLKHAGTYKIDHWNRDDKANGLTVLKEIAPLDGFRRFENMDKDDLWFYRRQDKALLEDSIAALTIMAASYAQKARLLSFVWENYDLSDADSPQQLVSSIGLEPNQARKDAAAFKRLENLGLDWPEGVNFEKISLILGAVDGVDALTPDESAEYREILISAVDKSWTDVKRRLNGTDGEIEATKPQKRKNLYYVVDDVAGELKQRFVFADEGEVAISDDRCAMRIDKVYPPLRRRKNVLYVMKGAVEEKLLEYKAE